MNFNGTSEGKPILKERVAEAAPEVKLGQFVALWAGQNNVFKLAGVAKKIRKAKRGEVMAILVSFSTVGWHIGQLERSATGAP